jgi:hypothetical protein
MQYILRITEKLKDGEREDRKKGKETYKIET